MHDGNSLINYKFSGHETFTFRYGWLKKAVDGVLIDSNIFKRDNAIVELGVGKNMVRSIAYWGLATQVLEVKNKQICVSNIGNRLLNNWDPFLEDPASLWLIHWLLSTNPSRAAVWYLAFNKYPKPDFTKETMLNFLVEQAARNSVNVKERTIRRDIDCFIRTYLPVQKGSSIEDTFSCPLNDLEILNKLNDDDVYQFNIGPKPSLAPEILGYALLSYIYLSQSRRKTISISDCLYKEGSPGQVFKLDENSLVEYVEQLQESTEGCIELDETAGLKQIYAKKDILPEKLLEIYYE